MWRAGTWSVLHVERKLSGTGMAKKLSETSAEASLQLLLSQDSLLLEMLLLNSCVLITDAAADDDNCVWFVANILLSSCGAHFKLHLTCSKGK